MEPMRYRIEWHQEPDGTNYWLVWRSRLMSSRDMMVAVETEIVRILRTKQDAEMVVGDLERIEATHDATFHSKEAP